MLIHAQLLIRHILNIMRQTIVGANLPTHIKRLCKENIAYDEITRVRTESICDAAPCLIQCAGKGLTYAAQLLHERRQLGMSGNNALGDLSKSAGESIRETCPHIGQCIFLILTQHRDLLAGAYVSRLRRQFGQVIGTRSFMRIQRHVAIGSTNG